MSTSPSFRNVPLPTVFTVLTLIVLMGCSAARKDEDGDPEANIGEYQITVTPAEVAISATHQAPIQIKLDAACNGPFPPVKCDQHSPNWDFTVEPAGDFPGTISIDNPYSPHTTASVQVNAAELKKRAPSAVTSLYTFGTVYRIRVSFFPKRVPNDLTVVGRNWTQFEFTVSPPPSQREEQNPNKPRLNLLGLSQNTLPFVLDLKQPSQTQTIQLSYSGLGNTITISGPVDRGEPGGAQKFRLLSPSSITLPGDGTQPPPIEIKFEVDAVDVLKTYTASLFVTLGKDRPIPIRLQGRREAF